MAKSLKIWRRRQVELTLKRNADKSKVLSMGVFNTRQGIEGAFLATQRDKSAIAALTEIWKCDWLDNELRLFLAMIMTNY